MLASHAFFFFLAFDWSSFAMLAGISKIGSLKSHCRASLNLFVQNHLLKSHLNENLFAHCLCMPKQGRTFAYEWMICSSFISFAFWEGGLERPVAFICSCWKRSNERNILQFQRLFPESGEWLERWLRVFYISKERNPQAEYEPVFFCVQPGTHEQVEVETCMDK